MSDFPLMLSVSGMRGLIGRSLTPPVAARYAAAFGSWLRQSTGEAHPHVVIGRDSRPSGLLVQQAAVAGLVAVGCRVTTLGIVTTPSVAIMTEHRHAHGGMVITASHNPIIWNGIKALRADGVAPPPEQAAQIIQRFHDDQVDYVDVTQLQPIDHDDTTTDVHLQRIFDHLDVEAIRKRKIKVVLDSVCGAGGPATAVMMRELGVELVHLYGEPTGIFPHTPEPTAENLTGLAAAVKEHGADIGMAQDPDADRLALVDETGRYIGEEYTLALSALHVMSRTPGPAAANLSTSRMIDDIAERFGGLVHRTPVGEASVAAMMRQHDAVIGGEGNGGIIWPKVICVRDSLAGAALMLELLATTGKSLSQLVADIPAYSIVKQKLPIEPGMADRAIEQVGKLFADDRIDLQDGIRVDLADSWVHVRPSNTEPILRIIAEAPREDDANALIQKVREALNP
ncbi:phosphoglucosamine mutase [Planctomycetales bacterium ZRK34]|nr:phosphoglucosamine mutase [Planctomycetales bacterium ZRK34]